MRRLGLAAALFLVLVPAVAAQDAADTRRVEVSLQDEGCPAGPDRFCVRPAEVTADEERRLVLEVTNEGSVRHNLTAAPGSPEALAEAVDVAPLAPDETAEVALSWDTLSAAREAAEGPLELVCGFEGHAALGERLVVQVGAGEQNPQPAPGAPLAALAVVGAALVLRREG